jgi:hypothetical protein
MKLTRFEKQQDTKSSIGTAYISPKNMSPAGLIQKIPNILSRTV